MLTTTEWSNTLSVSTRISCTQYKTEAYFQSADEYDESERENIQNTTCMWEHQGGDVELSRTAENRGMVEGA